MLQPETALKYVNELLTLDPNYFQALLLKGEILYSLWDLERSMLCFVKGRRMRPDNEDCIRGVHKVRMALEEITDFRKSTIIKKDKSKFKRSKSAKEREPSWSKTPSPISYENKYDNESTSYSPSPKCSTPSVNRSSNISSKEDRNKLHVHRPFTAHARRRTLVTDSQRELKLDADTKSKESLSIQGRPKTAVRNRVKVSDDTSSDSWDDSIFSTSEDKSISKSKHSSRKSNYDSDDSLYGIFKYSHSTSGEEQSVNIQGKKERRRKKIKNVRKRKNQTSQNSHVLKAKSSVAPKITPSLGKDKVFLENLIKDKGLKKTNTPYTKKVLRLARDLHNFVSERELYWKNREHFIRHAKPDEDIFIS